MEKGPSLDPVAFLMERLRKLPGVGEKTAARLAFFIMKLPREEATSLAQAILTVKEKMGLCSVCCNVTDVNPCRICRDPRRNEDVICVVENPLDLIALERGKEYTGRYHVLHGALSPLDGIGPDELHIKELLARLKSGGVKEVILAMNPKVEGEATSVYLTNLIKPLEIKVSRIAYGVPMGGDLEYLDQVTLSKALENRREL